MHVFYFQQYYKLEHTYSACREVFQRLIELLLFYATQIYCKLKDFHLPLLQHLDVSRILSSFVLHIDVQNFIDEHLINPAHV
jgi:hypothetical protein